MKTCRCFTSDVRNDEKVSVLKFSKIFLFLTPLLLIIYLLWKFQTNFLIFKNQFLLLAQNLNDFCQNIKFFHIKLSSCPRKSSDLDRIWKKWLHETLTKKFLYMQKKLFENILLIILKRELIDFESGEFDLDINSFPQIWVFFYWGINKVWNLINIPKYRDNLKCCPRVSHSSVIVYASIKWIKRWF